MNKDESYMLSSNSSSTRHNMLVKDTYVVSWKLKFMRMYLSNTASAPLCSERPLGHPGQFGDGFSRPLFGSAFAG